MTPERLARIKRANEIDACGIPKSMADDLIAEVERLQKADNFLDCLYAAGVDNWEGYSQATKMNMKEGE